MKGSYFFSAGVSPIVFNFRDGGKYFEIDGKESWLVPRYPDISCFF